MAGTLKQSLKQTNSFPVLFFCVLTSDTANQETTEEEETTEQTYLFRFKNLFPKQAIDFWKKSALQDTYILKKMGQDKEKVSFFLKQEKPFLRYLCFKPKQKQELCTDTFTSLSTKTCPKLNRVGFLPL